jgi:hypothetical protein
VSDGLGCSYTDSTDVSLPQPIQFQLNNGILCGNELMTNYDNSNASNFLWSSGETTASIQVNSTGTYVLSLQNAANCLLTASTQINTIEALPLITLDDIVATCDSAILDAGVVAPGMQYSWNNGATTQSIVVNNPMTYRVTVTSANGCIAIDSSIVNQLPQPVANFNFVSSNNAVAFSNLSSNATSYLWNFGDSTTATQVNPFHFYFDNDCYIVTLFATNSCGTAVFTDTLELGRSISDCFPTVIVSNQGTEASDENWNIYPNPNRGSFWLSLNASSTEEVSLELYSLEGRLIKNSTQIFQEGENTLYLDYDKLPSGSYWLRIQTAAKTMTRQIVILRD